MTTKNQLLKVIRKQCVECMGGQEREAEKCVAPRCGLFPYRSGRDPEPNAARTEAARRTQNFLKNPAVACEKSPVNIGSTQGATERAGA
jgi:hypothetical protein